MNFSKIINFLFIACCAFNITMGFTGHMSPFIGGLGWLTVLVFSFFDHLRDREDKKFKSYLDELINNTVGKKEE